MAVPERVKVVIVKVDGTEIDGLLEYESIPNLPSKQFTDDLDI